MRISFFFNRIYGFAPHGSPPFNVIPSPVQQIYSTAVTLLFICATFFYLYQFNVGDLYYSSTPALIQGNCYLFIVNFIFVAAYVFNDSMTRVMNELNKISAIIPKKKFQDMAKFIYTKDITTVIFMLCNVINLKQKSFNNTCLNITSYNLTFALFLMDMMYMNCVCVLKACFESLNSNIENIKETIVTSDPHLLRRVYHEKYNALLVERLYEVKKYFENVSKFVRRFNSTFSVHLFASVTITFFDITFNSYFYLLSIQGKQGINPERQIWYPVFFTPAIFHLLKIVGMTWICQRMKDEAQKVGPCVHDVMIQTVDKEFKDEVSIESF